MAKQGNYVTLPGVDPNWAKGISSALSDLSRSYNQKASEEKAAAERLAANEESKRRYEQGRADTIARNAVLDARYNEEQKIAADKYKTAQERLNRQEDVEKKARQKLIDRENALRTVDELVYSGALDNQTYSLDDYRPEMREVLQNQLSLVDRLSSGTANYLTGDAGQDTTSLVADYKSLLEKTGLGKDKAEVNNKVADFQNDLLSLQDERAKGGYDPESWQSRVNDIVARRFGTISDNINQGISEGQGMLRGSQLKAIMRGLDPKVRESLLISDVDKALGTNLSTLSRAQLLANEKTRADELNAAEEKQFNRNLEKLKLFKSASGGKSYNNAKDMISTLKSLGVEGPSADAIGSWDMTDVTKAFNYLVGEKGYNPTVVGGVLFSGVEDGWIDDTFPEMGSDNFANMEKQIAQMDKGAGSTGNGTLERAIADTDFTYTPAVGRNILDLQTQNFRIPGSDQYRLGVLPLYDRAAFDAREREAMQDMQKYLDSLKQPGDNAAATPDRPELSALGFTSDEIYANPAVLQTVLEQNRINDALGEEFSRTVGDFFDSDLTDSEGAAFRRFGSRVPLGDPAWENWLKRFYPSVYQKRVERGEIKPEK